MTSSRICSKGSQAFCYLCAKQGVTSKLAKFHVNLKEAILLCVNQACVYPLGSADISSFIVQNRIKETSSEMESKLTRPVCTPTDEGRSKSDKKFRESRHQFLTFKSATEEQTKSSANSMLTQFIPEMVNTGGPSHSVQKNKKFVCRVRRSTKTVFEPYIPRRKSSWYFLLTQDNPCNKECMSLPVDLEQSYKKLTNHEEKFVMDIVLNN